MNAEHATEPAVGSQVDQVVVPLVPERDVLDELREAAARKWRGDPAAQRAGLFARAADEVQHLREEVAELDALRDRLADLLTRTAVALRGPEPPLTRWSWHDVPDRAAAAVAAIDVMQRAAFMAASPERHNVGVKPPEGSA